MVMPSYRTEAGMAQGGAMAMPGTTAALEKMVVPAVEEKLMLGERWKRLPSNVDTI